MLRNKKIIIIIVIIILIILIASYVNYKPENRSTTHIVKNNNNNLTLLKQYSFSINNKTSINFTMPSNVSILCVDAYSNNTEGNVTFMNNGHEMIHLSVDKTKNFYVGERIHNIPKVVTIKSGKWIIEKNLKNTTNKNEYFHLLIYIKK